MTFLSIHIRYQTKYVSQENKIRQDAKLSHFLEISSPKMQISSQRISSNYSKKGKVGCGIVNLKIHESHYVFHKSKRI